MTAETRHYDEMVRWHGFDPLAERDVIAEAEALTEAAS